MKTFQDFQHAANTLDFIKAAINQYMASDIYKWAVLADQYDRQKNTTIRQWTKMLYTVSGQAVPDQYSSNNRIASNFFHRLNKERCTYSLGNGVTFANDGVKERLGNSFDNRLYKAGYLALIHGVSYGFWNMDQLYVFPATEFCPLMDEENGTLRAGIRFWSLDWRNKPVTAVLYEEDGYTVYRGKYGDKGLNFTETEGKRGYVQKVVYTPADGEVLVGEENYSHLPIVPLWGGGNRQSTLVGMREAIDSFDLIQSGFADDLQDCAQIYWLIGNNFGMDTPELQKFMDRLKLQHVANVDDQNSSVTPYTQDIPHEARDAFLSHIRKRIYEDFGALDVTELSGGQKTATEINSAYQPMDEEADDFEYQLIEFVQQVLSLQGIEDTPVFKRNRIANQKEQTDMITECAEYLDAQTILELLPFISKDQIPEIMARRDAEQVANLPNLDELKKAMEEADAGKGITGEAGLDAGGDGE